MQAKSHFGGCQCGAVRYAASSLGRASICHCRMCQRALGNTCAPLVTAHGLAWLRGEPKYFRSSNKVRRGFCGDCGTPLSYEPDGFEPEITVATLDDPSAVAPVIQVGLESRLPWFEALHALPPRPAAEVPRVAAFFAGLVSYQYQPEASRKEDEP